jgi:cytochrome c6
VPLLALNGYEVGLLVVAVCFIAFALIVSLVVPRARPDFPAKRLGIFIAVCIGLFFVQFGAVLALAELGPEEHAEAVEPPPSPGPPPPGEPPPPGPPPPSPAPGGGGEGDPAAGKQIFLGPGGCGSCHTLADAGTSGTVGPDLDSLAPSYEAALEQVTNGGGGMPPFKDSLSEQQIKDVAAYVSSATGG